MIHKEILPGPWTYNGNGIVRTLQYENSIPRIDIAIREAIQNSLDARNTEGSSLDMGFRFGRFSVGDFSRQLDDVRDKFSIRFGSEASFLEISDLDTVGLNGPLESNKRAEYGNLIKLVYSIGEKQQGSGKGGSWGYGKTCYYTIGVGIVAYYSKTIVDGEFQERLVVALIEDTDHRESMLFPEFDLGVSYWGSVSNTSNIAVAVTDADQIEIFLDIFESTRYGEEETGTKIIIPFIDEDDLCREMMDAIGLENRSPDKPLFNNLILLSVQRWYFPRIWNNHPDGDLRFFLNGRLLTCDDVHPLFKLMGEVFRSTYSDDSTKITSRSDCLGEPRVLAHYAYAEGKMSDLHVPFDTKLSTFLYAFSSNPQNLPIGFRCRSLGMVNCYDCGKGVVENAAPLPIDRYKIVGVRPQADTLIIDPKTKEKVTVLEEYIRKGENPAHSNWEDVDLREFNPIINAKPRLVSKILNDVSASVSEESESSGTSRNRNLGVGRAVGKRLLPNEGFGRYSSPKGSSGRGGGGKGSRSNGINVEYGVSYSKTRILIDCDASFGMTRGPYSLELFPETDEGYKTMSEWTEGCGMDFPIKIRDFEIYEVNGLPCDPPVILDTENPREVSGMEFKPESFNGRLYAMIMSKKESVSSLRMRISLHNGGSLFGVRIDLKEA